MKTLILDGNNCAWRMLHGLPILTAKGKPVQVIYGFYNLLSSVIKQFEPDKAMVCWDTGRSAYRMKIYPEYKGNRDHDSDHKKREQKRSVDRQVSILHETLKMLNVRSVDYPQTEADDLIGIATQCLRGETVVISSDKDMRQLVNDKTSVWSPFETTLFTQDNFYKKVGLTPRQWLEFRAITGEKTDNISGAARGFGEASAMELIQKYGSIKELFRSSVEKRVRNRGNRYALLYSEGAEERIKRNMKLMDLSLCCDREDGSKQKELIQSKHSKARSVNKIEVIQYFKEQKFQSIIERFGSWITPFMDLSTD